MKHAPALLLTATLTTLATLAGGCSSQPVATSNSNQPQLTHTTRVHQPYQRVPYARAGYPPATAFGMASGDNVAMKMGSEAMYARAKFRQNPALPNNVPQIEITTVPTKDE
ncbi:MAG: hypothetical protein LW822_06300 [Phycisphaeraceae bacterium]|jgi:hypothetical protein|nr:hypothetical protein [Phycisphaeraceae bacterium]